jgi:hypothetical protein
MDIWADPVCVVSCVGSMGVSALAGVHLQVAI